MVFSGCAETHTDEKSFKPSRDTVIDIVVKDGVNELLFKYLDYKWLFPLDVETNEQLTHSPEMKRTYTIQFQSDSLNGRPVVLEATKGRIDIILIEKNKFELTFHDTLNELQISMDFSNRPGFDRRRFYRNGELQRTELTKFDSVKPFLWMTYNAEE